MRTKEVQSMFIKVAKRQKRYSDIPSSSRYWVSWRDIHNVEEMVVLGFQEEICFGAYSIDGQIPISCILKEIKEALYDKVVNPENPAFLNFSDAMLWLILSQEEDKMREITAAKVAKKIKLAMTELNEKNKDKYIHSYLQRFTPKGQKQILKIYRSYK